ncbi:MAG: ammonium transporter [Lachnospiraceae bacterium]|nr:ammonium transporter [Lachnospiraceae bacterium]
MDFSIWYLVGAILVFFMQCGFAMVETGFTRAKNAGNIIMKNLMDFCIGTVVFIGFGYGIMNSGRYIAGVIGVPEYGMFADFAGFNWSNFVFQLVFCATAATIVSGAMAERTKFITYCIYSAVISLIVYPIEAGWVWNAQGWLAQMGFVDFAGSAVIHMVGGITAFIGAALLGPRIGKYTKDKKTGEVTIHAFPGHSLTLGALGCFILWFAWYGFNGAAATSVEQMAQIFGTTTLAPAVATVTCMIFTWAKNGKPDVSMCLNASLAGLVAITAGCSNVDAVGAIVIGIVSGILVDVVVEVVDQKIKVDDPVGAVAVHGANGLWGTIAVGLFDYNNGLFYGGGAHQLIVQFTGAAAILIYTAIVMSLVFLVLKHTIGLRVTVEEEVLGLDYMEHGLVSAYADFLPVSSATMGLEYEGDDYVEVEDLRKEKLAPVLPEDRAESAGRFTRITVVCKEEKFALLRNAMNQIGVTGMTVSHVMGCGLQKGKSGQYRGVEMSMNLLPKLQVDIVVSTVAPELVVAAAKRALHTGQYGDGKIFLYDVENVIRVRTGEEGYDALVGGKK